MSKQLMIYENITPVSSQQHGDLSVETGLLYDFARHLRAVPLVASEIPHAAREYTVVFAPAGPNTGVLPFALLGLRDDENLYLSESGEWTASYIPAFLRRYPFVFSGNQEQTKFTLCVDESWRGCNRDGRGERLFDANGNRTEFLDRLLRFNEDYQKSAQMTGIFCKKLQELELLETKEARLKAPAGNEIRLAGFSLLNRDKVNALPAETLSELASASGLELIYAQLVSTLNLPMLAQKVAAVPAIDESAATTG